MPSPRPKSHKKPAKKPAPIRMWLLMTAFLLLVSVWIGTVVPALRLQSAVSGSSTNVQLVVLAHADDVGAPYVEDMVPASGATLVPVSTGIEFHLKDYRNDDDVTAGSGVDLSSVVVTVTYGATTLTYQDGDPEFASSGVINNLTITITPAASFPGGTRITVAVDAADLHSPANVMQTFRYSFLTVPPVSSSSSSSSSSSTTAGTSASAGGVSGPFGGTRGHMSDAIFALCAEHLPLIIERRRLPNGSLTERVLPLSEARTIDRCYIDGPARLTHFLDVVPGAWYEFALSMLLKQGVIDATKKLFHPAHGATRAELATMLTRMAEIETSRPVFQSFTDVPVDAWYAPYVQAAAERRWMLGYGNCYGRTVNCIMAPDQTVTRAEAAAMIVRYFAFTELHLAPVFLDVSVDAWYAGPLRVAADRCIVMGEGISKNAAANRPVTRAELVTMLSRAQQDLRYDRECR